MVQLIEEGENLCAYPNGLRIINAKTQRLKSLMHAWPCNKKLIKGTSY